MCMHVYVAALGSNAMQRYDNILNTENKTILLTYRFLTTYNIIIC